MKRNKFSLSHYRLQTMNFGYLTPTTWFEALPGDSIQMRTNLLIRMLPLVAPVMHPVKVRIHNWFVPNRLIWDDWEDFITGGSDGKFEAVPPKQTLNGTVSQGTLRNYLGLPAGTYTDLYQSFLPFRAYQLIYNEYYRDEDLVEPAEIGTGSADDLTTETQLQRVSWEKDYFTSCRPSASKGDEIFIPLGTSAPIDGVGDLEPTFTIDAGATEHKLSSQTGQAQAYWDISSDGTGQARWADPKLVADLSQATGISVNELRTYLAQQRFQEARSRFGSRYSEYLKYLAPGIGNLDSRLQEPEYLGGGSSMISFSEILQTQRSEEDNTPLGTMGGHAISTMRTKRFRRFIPEHGIIMQLMSIVPKAIYSQEIERKWHRLNKEMYYQKELQFIGEQPVTNREVYVNHSDPLGTFGYIPRYDEYRFMPSSVVGEFESSIADNWHYARIFQGDVALNKSFVECNPAMRPSAVADGDQVYAMINHSIQARRILSKNSNPKTF